MFGRMGRQLATVSRKQTRYKSISPIDHEIDELGMPIKPTWSVNDLLSQSPSPSISSETLAHLHKLAALVPPEAGSPEHAKLTAELEDMVKLVEAVRHVNVDSVREEGVVPDGRLWQAGRGMAVAKPNKADQGRDVEESGSALLRHAQRTVGGFYVVEHQRRR